MSLYNSDGQIRVNITDGNSLTGLQSPDGSINVVLNDGTKLLGRYHPSGAYNGIAVTSAKSSGYAPNGSIYVTSLKGEYVMYSPSFSTETIPTYPSSDILTTLGSDLIAYWDANRGDTFTSYSNAVASWFDIKAGYELKAADVQYRPVYKNTGLAGAPSVYFDTNTYLTCTDAGLLSALPSDANPSEIWCLCKQSADPSDTTTRHCASYGGISLTTGRSIARIVTSGVNRTRSYTGIGASASTTDNTTTDLTGIHVLRQSVGATSTSLDIDGGTPGSVSAVPSTTNQRLRVGSLSASGPSNNWNGEISAVLVTLPLSTQKAAALHTYFG